MSDAGQTHPTTHSETSVGYDRDAPQPAWHRSNTNSCSPVRARELQVIFARQPKPPEAGDPWEGFCIRAELPISRVEDLVRQLRRVAALRE
jgi:hypothetical protein